MIVVLGMSPPWYLLGGFYSSVPGAGQFCPGVLPTVLTLTGGEGVVKEGPACPPEEAQHVSVGLCQPNHCTVSFGLRALGLDVAHKKHVRENGVCGSGCTRLILSCLSL